MEVRVHFNVCQPPPLPTFAYKHVVLEILAWKSFRLIHHTLSLSFSSSYHFTSPWHDSTNGHGSEWDVRSEERVNDFDVGASPACSAWDPVDARNLAVVSRGANETYLVRNDDPGKGTFRKGYTRRCAYSWSAKHWTQGLMFIVLINADRATTYPLPEWGSASLPDFGELCNSYQVAWREFFTRKTRM